MRLDSRAICVATEISRVVPALHRSAARFLFAARLVRSRLPTPTLSMLHPCGRARVSYCALALLAAALPFAGVALCADESPQPTPAESQQPPEPMPDPKASEPWSVLPGGGANDSDDHIVRFDQRQRASR